MRCKQLLGFDRSGSTISGNNLNFTLIWAKIKPNFFLLPAAIVRVADGGRYFLHAASWAASLSYKLLTLSAACLQASRHPSILAVYLAPCISL
jgi:hypothetical protein